MTSKSLFPMLCRVKYCFGVTGLPGSGKSCVIRLLKELGEAHNKTVLSFSHSDELRRIQQTMLLPETRSILTEIANELRRQHGNDAVTKLVLTRLHHELANLPTLSTDLITLIDSIRRPEEVTFLRSAFGQRFNLLAIDSPIELIKERLANRRRERELDGIAGNPDKINRLLETEWGANELTHGVFISAAIHMADFVIRNDTTIEDLRLRLEQIVKVTLH